MEYILSILTNDALKTSIREVYNYLKNNKLNPNNLDKDYHKIFTIDKEIHYDNKPIMSYTKTANLLLMTNNEVFDEIYDKHYDELSNVLDIMDIYTYVIIKKESDINIINIKHKNLNKIISELINKISRLISNINNIQQQRKFKMQLHNYMTGYSIFPIFNKLYKYQKNDIQKQYEYTMEELYIMAKNKNIKDYIKMKKSKLLNILNLNISVESSDVNIDTMHTELIKMHNNLPIDSSFFNQNFLKYINILFQILNNKRHILKKQLNNLYNYSVCDTIDNINKKINIKQRLIYYQRILLEFEIITLEIKMKYIIKITDEITEKEEKKKRKNRYNSIYDKCGYILQRKI